MRLNQRNEGLRRTLRESAMTNAATLADRQAVNGIAKMIGNMVDEHQEALQEERRRRKEAERELRDLKQQMAVEDGNDSTRAVMTT